MSKNKKIISVSIDPDLHELLVDLKKKRGSSVSNILEGLAEKFIDLLDSVEGDHEVIPLIVEIPEDVKGEPAREEWVIKKEKAIVNFADSLSNEELIPIVLKVPKNLRSDTAALKEWLQSRVDAIAGRLSV